VSKGGKKKKHHYFLSRRTPAPKLNGGVEAHAGKRGNFVPQGRGVKQRFPEWGGTEKRWPNRTFHEVREKPANWLGKKNVVKVVKRHWGLRQRGAQENSQKREKKKKGKDCDADGKSKAVRAEFRKGL